MNKKNISLQPGEEILPIIEYEGLYSVTSNGRVLSHEKIRKFENYQSVYKAKFLKPGLNGGGYLLVNLYKDNEKKSYKVHRLEALAFIENPQNDL